MDDGIKIAMSPVQLAAALSDKTVTEAETMSNRLLGGWDLSWVPLNWLVQLLYV